MDRITIETGMQDISSGTCIKFVPRTHEANFLDIQPRYGWVWQLHIAFTCKTCLTVHIYISIYSNSDVVVLHCNDTCNFCPVLQAAGHFWGRLEEARSCHYRLLGACGQEWPRMSSCMLLALYTSSPAQTETTTSQLYGKTSYQVRMNDRLRVMLQF